MVHVEHSLVPEKCNPERLLYLIQVLYLLLARAPQKVNLTLLVIHILNEKVLEVTKGFAMGRVDNFGLG